MWSCSHRSTVPSLLGLLLSVVLEVMGVLEVLEVMGVAEGVAHDAGPAPPAAVAALTWLPTASCHETLLGSRTWAAAPGVWSWPRDTACNSDALIDDARAGASGAGAGADADADAGAPSAVDAEVIGRAPDVPPTAAPPCCCCCAAADCCFSGRPSSCAR